MVFFKQISDRDWCEETLLMVELSKCAKEGGITETPGDICVLPKHLASCVQISPPGQLQPSIVCGHKKAESGAERQKIRPTEREREREYACQMFDSPPSVGGTGSSFFSTVEKTRPLFHSPWLFLPRKFERGKQTETRGCGCVLSPARLPVYRCRPVYIYRTVQALKNVNE